MLHTDENLFKKDQQVTKCHSKGKTLFYPITSEKSSPTIIRLLILFEQTLTNPKIKTGL